MGDLEERRKRKNAAKNKDAKRMRQAAVDEKEHDTIQFKKHHQHLKRVREPDDNVLIVLGSPIHGILKPNMCGPKIKRRFIDPPD